MVYMGLIITGRLLIIFKLNQCVVYYSIYAGKLSGEILNNIPIKHMWVYYRVYMGLIVMGRFYGILIILFLYLCMCLLLVYVFNYLINVLIQLRGIYSYLYVG